MPTALWASAVASLLAALAALAARADRRGAPTRRPPAIRTEGRGEERDVFVLVAMVEVCVGVTVVEAGIVEVAGVCWVYECVGVGESVWVMAFGCWFLFGLRRCSGVAGCEAYVIIQFHLLAFL